MCVLNRCLYLLNIDIYIFHSRDENKVQEPVRKTDFSNVSDPPKAFPEAYSVPEKLLWKQMVFT